MENGFAAQTPDLIMKVASLEKEQKKSTADMQKLIRAVAEKTTTLEEQTTVLE